MAFLPFTCPHCRVKNIALQITSGTAVNAWAQSVNLVCPRCKLPSGATVRPRSVSQRNGFQTLLKSNADVLQNGWHIVDFWPKPPAPKVPDLLPKDVARIYLQAERNLDIEGNEEAAGTMYRKALDVGLRKVDPATTGPLAARTKKLAAAGKLTADIADWSDHIRVLGNGAVHEEDAISRDELMDLRNFADMVLQYLFTLPAMVKKRRGEEVDWLDAP